MPTIYVGAYILVKLDTLSERLEWESIRYDCYNVKPFRPAGCEMDEAIYLIPEDSGTPGEIRNRTSFSDTAVRVQTSLFARAAAGTISNLQSLSGVDLVEVRFGMLVESDYIRAGQIVA